MPEVKVIIGGNNFVNTTEIKLLSIFIRLTKEGDRVPGLEEGRRKMYESAC